MTSASATSRSRWRSSLGLVAFGLGLVALGLVAFVGGIVGGCGESRRTERDIVATIDTPAGALELDQRVVEDIAAREKLDEGEARERALDQLRLVAARRVELDERETAPEHPDDLDPARREHLERAALARLWLREVFEPAHAAGTIPERVIQQNLADPSLTQRLFHPTLWFVCQALIVPSDKGEDGRSIKAPTEGEAGERWQADAGRAFAPLVARVEAVADELVANEDCSVLANIVGASKREFESDSGGLTIRYERFVFAPSEAQNFDQTWVETVTERAEPHVVGPFATQFGLHLVVVNRIEPASLPAGSMPADQLAAAREAKLRAELEQAWRADQLQRTLAEARDRRVVRLAAELD